MRKVLGWIGVAVLGAATAVLGQIMTNRSMDAKVEQKLAEGGYILAETVESPEEEA